MRRNAIGLLVSAMLFALYCTLPFIGMVSMGKLTITFVFYFIICIVGAIVAYKICNYILPKIHCEKIEVCIYTKWTERRFFLVCWSVLLVGLIPAYLAFFPGIFGYDAPNQLQQIMGEVPYSSHHPYFHTVILGAFLKFGKRVAGTYNVGVALFCITQGIVISGSLAYSFLVMKRLRTPFPVLIMSLVWCVWNPVMQVLTFNTTKDILFGAFFLHFVLNCYYWLASHEKKTKQELVKLIVSGVLMCLLRNQGIYIIIVLLLISLAVNWKDKRFLASLCSIVVISQLFFTITNNVFYVEKGDAREMLSVPMQQMALVCKLYSEGQPVNLTQEEFDKFTLVVNEEHLKDFSLLISDPIKSHFNTYIVKDDLAGYLSMYISVGIRNLGYYMTAFRGLILSYWDMTVNQFRGLAYENTFPEISQRWGISQKSILLGYKEYLIDYISNQMEKKLPFISWLLQPGLCIWIMSALIGLTIAKKDKAVFLAVLTGLLFLGTLLLGPIALLRYIYPLMLLTPWLLALLCNKINSL